MRPETARTVFNRLQPWLARDLFVVFYGGEPLLNYPLIEEAVVHMKTESARSGRRVRFGVVTNGNRFDDRAIEFFAEHRLTVGLSFDGRAQDAQRAPGSETRIRNLIERILERPRIRLETNSVFAPENIGRLADSIIDLLDMGVPAVRFNADAMRPWGGESLSAWGVELARLRREAVRRYRREGRIRIRTFAEGLDRGIRVCTAGTDRLAVDTSGRLWGCAIFADWVRDKGGPTDIRRFSLGRIDGVRRPAFDERRRRVAARYAEFSVDRNSTPAGSCRFCPDRGGCRICPVVAALAGGGFRFVPGFLCELQRIQSRAIGRLAAVL